MNILIMILVAISLLTTFVMTRLFYQKKLRISLSHLEEKHQGLMIYKGDDDYEKEVILIDKDKKRYYVYTHPMNMPILRAYEMNLNISLGEANITRDELLNYLAAIKVLFNKGEIRDSAALMVSLEERTDFLAEENVLKRIACAVIIHEDEDPNTISDKWTKHKMALMDNNIDIKAAFLQSAFSKLKGSALLTEENLLAYLEGVKVELRPQRARVNTLRRSLQES